MSTDNYGIDKIIDEHHHVERGGNERIDIVSDVKTNSELRPNLGDSHQLESSHHDEVCCSVLTTVIDYVMMIPTQIYERDEYELNLQQLSSTMNNTDDNQKPQLQLVPVMRIFGPIIRRQRRLQSDADSIMDNHYLNRRPYQSACLYVHGAYPYMVARPRLAGLDGSCSSSNDCPWDSPTRVQQMIGTIQEILEKAVQETNMSFLHHTSGGDVTPNGDRHVADKIGETSDAKKSFTVVNNHLIIRQITVVMGRGFYGYCSGPTAPFLRIEYYNPQDRWKVKRCLERGISLDTSSMTYTPESFFPKPRVKREHGSEYDINCLDETGALLRFHCFEAHIPYTMQFFKDFNLAGMSYIHVSEPIHSSERKNDSHNDTDVIRNGPVLFRHPMPRSVRITKKPKSANDETDTKILSSGEFRPWVFLESNTSQDYLWSSEIKPSHSKHMDSMSPAEKATSCDVDLDTHVSNIANQFDIMVNLPTQYDDRQRVHWRAVPSLHEIWKQERRRMSKLLPPQEDFLSHSSPNLGNDPMSISSNTKDAITDENNTPPFTLNVQADDIVIPGAKLAVEGMKRLIQLTSGLDENFRRVMQQIVRRHEKSINETDLDILHRHKQLKMQVDENELTPSYEETVEALGLLGSLFNKECTSTVTYNGYADDIVMEVRGATSNERMSQESVGTQRLQTKAEKTRLDISQACSSSMVLHERDSSLVDEYVLSQRVERGDGIIGNHFESIDDVINPETLAPYDFFDDEDDHDDGDDDKVKVNDDDRLQNQESKAEFDEQKMTQLLTGLNEQAGLVDCAGDDISVDSLILLQRNHETSGDNHKNGASHNFSEQDDDSRKIEHKRSLSSPERNVQPQVPVNTGFDFAPIFCAPAQKDVQLWYQKQGKYKRPNSDLTDTKSLPKRRKHFIDDQICSTNPLDDAHNVEEVDWVHNQDEQLVDECPELDYNNMLQSSEEGEVSNSSSPNEALLSDHVLEGIGNQGGRIYVEKGGDLKATTRPSQISHENEPLSNDILQSPVTIMAIEIFVQCRTGRAGINDSSAIAMTPDSLRDKISAIVYVMCEDPGGGDPLKYHERGCIFVPVTGEWDSARINPGCNDLDSFVTGVQRSLPKVTLGVSSHLSFECVRDERQLLLRLASIVRRNDPDVLLSWDTQASGLGYIVERGNSIARDAATNPDTAREIDMARLLGRTPRKNIQHLNSQLLNTLKLENKEISTPATVESARWYGSGLGADWDDRVGAGAPAASIVRSNCCGDIYERHANDSPFCPLSVADLFFPDGRLLPTRSSTYVTKRL